MSTEQFKAAFTAQRCIHLLLYNPRAKADLKRRDIASTHSQLRGRHKDTYWLLIPDSASARLAFHVSGFVSALHFGCSVSSLRFSRGWQCHSDVRRHIRRFVFTVFGFALFFMSCYFVIWATIFKETTSWKKKKNLTPGYTSQSWKNNNGERSFAGSLIWSPGIFMLFCLINPPRCWQIWQVWKAVLRPAVCQLGLMCQRGGLKSSPCFATETQQPPQANISWHFPWQHGMSSLLSTTVDERMRFFFSPDKINLYDACHCVCSWVWVCLGLEISSYFWHLVERLSSLLKCFAIWCHLQKAIVRFRIIRREQSSYILLGSTWKQFTPNFKK